jgi:pimeloyl-ACP methyl ester carboxylesterase
MAPVIAVGWSSGGFIATEPAITRPDLVLGLVLVERRFAGNPRGVRRPLTDSANSDGLLPPYSGMSVIMNRA